jgi:hypothetical protein
MMKRNIPLNLPARAKMNDTVAGNPETSRLESAVANSFPGLEIDHRNLDRRFFPGLVFDFLSDGPMHGAILTSVDPNDPEQPQNEHSQEVLEELDRLLPGTSIFLHALEQKGKRVTLGKPDASNVVDRGVVAWRLVRMLQPGRVSIELAQYEGKVLKKVHKLSATRRTFQSESGVLSEAYIPGELTQSLCSPWQHDFRDCTCNYWASNHPDIVLPSHPSDIQELAEGDQTAALADEPVLWLRWDRRVNVAPVESANASRPLEMDHYEINKRWQDLSIVLEGRERATPYSVDVTETAEPLPAEEVPGVLAKLAGMEHALALEYLYARYSVRFGDPKLSRVERDHADFLAHELLAIAVSEMMHLRWANQLMWELAHNNPSHSYQPALLVAEFVPDASATSNGDGAPKGMRHTAMRPLHVAVDSFIAAEQPSGTLEGQYARVFATLRRGYPVALSELVSRIMADGASHYSRFLQLRAVLRHDGKEKLIRNLEPGRPDDKRFAVVASAYGTLLRKLFDGYRSGDAEDRAAIPAAREEMHKIDAEATVLATKGVGVPFYNLSRGAAKVLKADT